MRATLLFFVLLFLTSTDVDYEKKYGSDYKTAVKFMTDNTAKFKKVCDDHKVDIKICKAIVFPELIRYSYLSDLFETVALEWVYVNGGSKAADFSIGNFQMKPSFVENMEVYVSAHGALKEYEYITKYDSGSSVRAQRIVRMKNVDWQIKYVACFYDLCGDKFKTEKFNTDDEKVKFYATAYNSGYNQTAESIKKKFKNKYFPYGPGKEVEQYPYCDVSLFYFKKMK